MMLADRKRLWKCTTPLLAAVMLIFLMACGVKTAPYPESATLPNQVRDLTQVINDSGELVLSWRPPETNMLGRPLKSLGGFDIEMADYVADDKYCLGCPHQYIKIDRVPVASPPPGMEFAPGPYTWRYKVKQGHVYHFRVTAVSESGGRHPDAQSEAVVWALSNPGALAGFSASMGDRSVVNINKI